MDGYVNFHRKDAITFLEPYRPSACEGICDDTNELLLGQDLQNTDLEKRSSMGDWGMLSNKLQLEINHITLSTGFQSEGRPESIFCNCFLGPK